MLSPSSTAMTDVLMPTGIEGVDLIPANIDLSAGEVQLINEVGREHTLARALRPVLHAYDYVLIDCQPSLGLLTVNALACAHGVIIPLAAEYFSLRGVALLVDTISKVQERINPRAVGRGRADHHVRRSDRARPRGRRDAAPAVRRHGVRHRHRAHREVPGDHRRRGTDHLLRPDSPAAQAYRALAREVIAR